MYRDVYSTCPAPVRRCGAFNTASQRGRSVRSAGIRVWLVCVAMTGCQIGTRDYTNENDKLRGENLQLRAKVTELENALRQRQSQLKALETRIGNQGAVSGVAPSDLPHVVEIRFGRLSGAVDTDSDGRDDIIRVYAKTKDHLGRFLPAIGPAVIQAVVILPDRQPEVLAQRALTPKEFEASYRTGLTGSHFTIELTLPDQWPGEVEQVTVKLTFTDAATGASHRHEQAIAIQDLP